MRASQWNSLVSNYSYIVGWSNKLASSSGLSIFVTMCLKFDLEKILALPLLLLSWYILAQYRHRASGAFENDFLDSELTDIRKTREKFADTYRPIAQLKVSVPRAKNVRSRDLGLPGRAYATVCYAPDARPNAGATADGGADGGAAGGALYEIGSTATARTTANPVWDEEGRVHNRKLSSMGSEWKGRGSKGTGEGSGKGGSGWGLDAIRKGADHLITSSVGGTVTKNTRSGTFTNVTARWGADHVFLYPLLQPVDEGTGELRDWRESEGAIVIRVYLENVFNSLMDDCLGEAVIPLKTLVAATGEEGKGEEREQEQEQDVVAGFWRLGEGGENAGGGGGREGGGGGIQEEEGGGATPAAPATPAGGGGAGGGGGEVSSEERVKREEQDYGGNSEGREQVEGDSSEVHASSGPLKAEAVAMEKKCPLVFARLQLTLGAKNKDKDPTAEERESSIAIAQELNELMDAKGDGEIDLNLIGSSLDTVKGLMKTAQWVQNFIGTIADTVERCFNILNWTDPRKTGIVFAATVTLLLLFAVFPTRYLILAGGLGEFVNGFRRRKAQERKMEKERAGRGRRKKKAEKTTEKKPSKESAVSNLIMSTPTNEDLRRFYFWESKRRGEAERNVVAEKRRVGRLATIWQAKWQGRCLVREERKRGGDSDILGGSEFTWRSAFAVLQSHRVSWWRGEREFDGGEESAGQVMFLGHSGLAGLSPLDLKALSPAERVLVTAVFGRGREGGSDKMEQLKVLLKFESEGEKERFEEMVVRAMTKVD